MPERLLPLPDWDSSSRVHPDRPKLPDRLAEEIARAISDSHWTEWLPQERLLAAELKTSRSSLRLALAVLRQRGMIESVPRRGSRIALQGVRRRSRRPDSGTVNLLLPGPVEEIRPTVVQWIEELRTLLAGKAWRLRLITSKTCFGRSPEGALREVFRRNPAECWLVRLSTLPMQRWFEHAGQPVVIAGTCHPGIRLPFVDLDHRSLSRHATGAMIAAGHRRILLLVDEDGKAGDLESERGFTEAADMARHPDLTVGVARHNGTVGGVVAQMNRLLRLTERPTALLSTQAVFCLTIWSCLPAAGIAIPSDLSVITQVGAPYLGYLNPQPTCYRIDPRKYAALIWRAMLDAMQGGSGRRPHLLLPEFVRGASLRRLA